MGRDVTGQEAVVKGTGVGGRRDGCWRKRFAEIGDEVESRGVRGGRHHGTSKGMRLSG